MPDTTYHRLSLPNGCCTSAYCGMRIEGLLVEAWHRKVCRVYACVILFIVAVNSYYYIAGVTTKWLGQVICKNNMQVIFLGVYVRQ